MVPLSNYSVGRALLLIFIMLGVNRITSFTSIPTVVFDDFSVPTRSKVDVPDVMLLSHLHSVSSSSLIIYCLLFASQLYWLVFFFSTKPPTIPTAPMASQDHTKGLNSLETAIQRKTLCSLCCPPLICSSTTLRMLPSMKYPAVAETIAVGLDTDTTWQRKKIIPARANQRCDHSSKMSIGVDVVARNKRETEVTVRNVHECAWPKCA